MAYAFAPQSEWAYARAHTALCAAVSSSERDRRSCATTIVVVAATHTVALNKDTGLSGRGLQAHRSRSQGATTSHSAIFASILSHGIAVGRSGVTGMACLPSLIGMRGRCAVVEEQDCWLLVVTRCVAGRVALTRQAVVVGLLPRRLDRKERTYEPSYHVLRRFGRR